jgi:hypothetical protein
MPETVKISIPDGKSLHDLAIFSGRTLEECAKFFLRGTPDVYGARAVLAEISYLQDCLATIEARAKKFLPNESCLKK